MITQVVGGHIDAMWGNLATVLQFENTGKIEVGLTEEIYED
jgi:tripartite-type tricarboxylate transporter receptor subunit TctC